jgi:glycosyltransferase involved in cell wall biosynthesis
VYNICHITSVHPRYDIRIFHKECVTLAQNSDYKIHLIVADGLPDESIQQVHIHSVAKPKNRIERIIYTQHAIYKKILQLNPQIIHFHDPELLLLGKKLAKSYKVIYDCHEDLPKQILTKHWIPKIIRLFVATIVKLVEQYLVKYMTCVITTTSIINTRLGKYNAKSITVCNYPVISKSLTTNNSEYHHRKFSLCYIGSISRSRGIVELLQSLTISKLQLELAGPFSSDINLQQLKQLPGSQYVNYHGVLNQDAIKQLLSQVKIGIVTLLPTPSYIESLPIKMFEYMQAGIPVIASNFLFWQDIIIKHECGVVVNPYDYVEVANKCLQLIAHPEYSHQLGINGQHSVTNLFNWNSESKKLCKLYTDILTT